MGKTGSAPVASRLGERPARSERPGCGRCGHPRALHSNGTTGCKAFACTAGPDGAACEGFTAQAAEERDQR